MYEEIKKGVPNIPEEVIKLWLLPFAEELGWPPTNNGWYFKLAQKPISFWNDADWGKEELNIPSLEYSGGYFDTMNGLFEAYIQGVENIYWRHLGEDGKSRFYRCLDYVIKHQKFPQPPVLYINELNKYEIMDGNHRFFGLVTATRTNEAFEASTAEEKQLFLEQGKLKGMAFPYDIQEVWVCRPHWGND